jgi:ferredoxin-NADP reductase
MDHPVRILEKKSLTHDVLRIRVSKPDRFSFSAGQGIELSLDDEQVRGKRSPFTLTGLNSEPYLELMIKIYPAHNGLTLAISKKRLGDILFLSDPWDSFRIKGPGVFIAGGAGVTPFVAILRQFNLEGRLDRSKLFFSNKTKADVFLENEFHSLLGANYINVLTREDSTSRINEAFLANHVSDFSVPFYLCGPGNFVNEIQGHLTSLGGVTKEMVDLIL